MAEIKDNIAVIGGTGFIGLHFIKQYHAVFGKVICVARDKNKFLKNNFPENVHYVDGAQSHQHLINELKSHNVSYILDLAYTTVPKTSFDDPLNDISSNLYTTVNMFEYARELKLKKMIWISTGGAIYGQTEKQLLSETDAVNPISPYGITKLSLEKYAYMYYKIYNLPIVCVRPSNAYGPGQLPYRGQGFIATVIASILDRKTIQLYGESGTIRDYIYIDDLCKGLYKILALGKPGEVYNMGTGIGMNNIAILDILKEYAAQLNVEPKVEILSARPFDVEYNVLSYDKLRQATGWNPEMNFEEGLRITWQWYLDQYQKGLLT